MRMGIGITFPPGMPIGADIYISRAQSPEFTAPMKEVKDRKWHLAQIWGV